MTWVIEFGAPTAGSARDLARQSVPAGQMVPPVHQQGRCGWEAQGDWDFASKLRDLCAERGYEHILSKR